MAVLNRASLPKVAPTPSRSSRQLGFTPPTQLLYYLTIWSLFKPQGILRDTILPFFSLHCVIWGCPRMSAYKIQPYLVQRKVQPYLEPQCSRNPRRARSL